MYTVRGVCGKVQVEAKIEDLLIYLLKGIFVCSSKLWHLGLKDTAVDYYIINSLFIIIANANFDTKKLYLLAENGVNLRDDFRIKYIETNLEIERFYEYLFESKEVLLDFEKALEFAGEKGFLRTRDVDRRSLVETVLEGNINNINNTVGNNKVSLYLNSEEGYHFTEEEINSTYGYSHGNSLGNYVARVWSFDNNN